MIYEVLSIVNDFFSCMTYGQQDSNNMTSYYMITRTSGLMYMRCNSNVISDFFEISDFTGLNCVRKVSWIILSLMTYR